MKYAYPAVLTREDSGLYSVLFPDLESCYTSGDDLADALIMAEDVLAATLFDYERDGKPIPKPTPLESLPAGDGSFATLVACDTREYRKRNNARAVKKTLTIPEWMNEAAMEANINFSQVLQDALRERLDGAV